MTEKKDFGWLVHRRSKIQFLLLRLHTFGKQSSPRSLNPWQTALFELLVGATFALWRAAFLADAERPRTSITADANKFLELLIRDNAIAYTQDKNTRAWTVGYYLNDAYSRLRLCQEIRSVHEPGFAANAPPKDAIEAYFDTLRKHCRVKDGPRVLWDTAYEVTHHIFHGLLRTVPNGRKIHKRQRLTETPNKGRSPRSRG
jgi:hypothetical protein